MANSEKELEGGWVNVRGRKKSEFGVCLLLLNRKLRGTRYSR